MKITDEKLMELLGEMEVEEPSMSFTRNVMHQIDLEIPPVSLKTKVDGRIITGLAFTFISAMIFIVTYAVIESHLVYELPEFKLHMNLDKGVLTTLIYVFLFLDLVIVLLYFDRLLRNKRA
jgi:hypothetical protein